ncbi:cyclin-domain-containing protein, partial [Blyttiomyces helicus]
GTVVLLVRFADLLPSGPIASRLRPQLISHNDKIPLTTSNLTRFHSRGPPNITIADYLRRIVRYAAIEKSVLLLLLIYIDRICEIHPTFTISSLTAHRFIICAITTGSKALSDIYCTNTHFAKVGGISVVELNVMEVEFCQMINWRLAGSVDILQQYFVNLVRTSSVYATLSPHSKNG